MSFFDTIRERIATFLFGDIIDARVHAAVVSVRVDDSPGWDVLAAGPADRPWAERLDDLDSVLVAWRKNFFIHRLVTLTHSYVVGNGITVTSKNRTIDTFICAFWSHRKNLIDRRLGAWCDELTRAGEIFPVLFTNKVDGMSYVRIIPASRIRVIETAPDDYETELRYGEIQNSIEPKWWLSPLHPDANKPDGNSELPPVMLHFTVNKVVGATRGEGDLGSVLPWCKRYAEWLKDRVRLNRQRTRQGLLDVEIADATMVEEKRKQLRTSNPVEAGIYVRGPGEVLTMHNLQIRADDVKDDGKALRLAIAAGSQTALHYLGEGESTNYSTAKEMGEPTSRFYTDRQTTFSNILTDLVEAAYQRKVDAGRAAWPARGLRLETTAAEVARADNASLAKAARDIVEALVKMKEHGWIDDHTAIRTAFKFAGEPLGVKEINAILEEEVGSKEVGSTCSVAQVQGKGVGSNG
jgi:hypothetical protein